jgi:Tol biopolymer transport system component
MPIDLARGKMTGPPVVENYGPPTRADWSVDGKFLAYNSTGSNGIKSIAIRSVESGSLRELQPALQYFPFPRWMPDGRSLITAGRDLKGRNGIYQIDARTGEVASVTEGRVGAPAVSPDGRKIYYGVDFSPRTPGSPRFVFVERDLASGTTRDVYQVPEDSLSGFAEVSPDGRYLAAIISDKASTTDALMQIPVSGGEPRELLRVNRPEWFHRYAYLSWTPDNNALVVGKFNANDKKELWLVPISDGNARKLDIDISAMVSRGFRLSPDGRQIAFVVGEDAREIWALENFLPVRAASK